MELVELGKLCDFINGDRGKNYPSQKSFISEGIPFISAKDLKNSSINKKNLRFISETVYNKLSSGKLKDNDILFCLRGSLGKFGINSENIKGAIASSLVIIRPKDNLELNYLKHYLSSLIFKNLVIKSDNGTSQPNLSVTNVKGFKIPLPNLATQKRIANILDEADKLRQFNKAIIEKYDALTQSLFLEMFGDPIENQKNWKVNRLKEISIKILSGNTPKGGSKVYVKNGITFFRSQNIWRNRIELDDVVCISQDIHNNMQKSSLKNGDILITKTGRINTENSSLGRAAMFMGKDDSANINGHVYLIRLKEDIINEFVLFILTTHKYKEYIRSVCVGGIDKRQINKTHLEEFPIISPPIKLQNEFAKRIQIIEKQKQQAQEALQKSEDLFNSLLQKAFKGELA
ncbi:restriction endonuclease subunit S [uncultured Kordia sp.]|uniref:restriction endonuclease subunit S n=1 Tax=uncultured Kordia sp. TaxID=507699 RepID=UPI002603C4A7|nr:restriction endonuclease subunit S [uncultured Kordia sp.]